MSKSGFFWNDKKEQRFTNTSSKPILTGVVSRNWVEFSSLNEEKMITLFQVVNNFDEIRYFCMNNYWNKIGNFVNLMWKVSMRWKNWRDFKGPHSMIFSRKRMIEDRDTILELTAKIQELQNEVNCMNDSRDFLKMLNQYAVDYPTFPINQRFSHLFEILAEC